MVEDLALAEQLQRRALKNWEELNAPADIAYSLDALALTLKEEKKCGDAISVYERILPIHDKTRDFLIY